VDIPFQKKNKQMARRMHPVMLDNGKYVRFGIVEKK
jgi:hypothetical protein